MGWDGGGAVLAGTLELLDGAERAEGEGERPRLGIFKNYQNSQSRDRDRRVSQKSSEVVSRSERGICV